ncbi:MAG TPA: lysophospholipid acyltransferase family protein [Acidimicrobiales bacterium]|nr:lysophospholipid acyltransferase family protein [Acidimicrobiales bacterium]
MKDAPARKRPAAASAPLTKAKILVAFARQRLPNPTAALNQFEFPLRAPSVPGGVEPLPPERRTGADYDTEWARRPAARLTRRAITDGLVRPLSNALADPEVTGQDRLDMVDGPVIFTANHHSHLDTPLLIGALPTRFRHKVFAAAAADYFFGNRVTGAASALVLNAIPMERTRISRRSADESAELLDDGWSMVIFPEGGRSPDGWGRPFKGGAAYLAVRCDVPVVPVHIGGTDRLFPKGTKRPKPGSTRVTFGTPLLPAEGEDSRRLGPRIEAAVAALADEVDTDWYSAKRRFHSGDTPSLTGPDATSWRRTWQLGERKPLHRGKRSKHQRAWP